MGKGRKKEPHSAAGQQGGLTRRGFIASVSAGAVTVAACRHTEPAQAPQACAKGPDGMHPVTLNVNARRHHLLVEPRWSLLFVLREKLGLTATKVGCERGECGACTVLIDEVPRYACMTLAVEADGAQIMTNEGLLDGEDLGVTQQAFVDQDAFQCGYCTSGQVMATEGLLRKNPQATEDEILRGLSGNVCRCGAYPHIVAAAKQARERKRNEGGR